MDANRIKEKLIRSVDAHAGEILAVTQEILVHPELGFKEFHTREVTEAFFDRYGIPYTAGHAITGVAGRLKGKESRINLCLIGEMDAVKCIGHPNADLNTGAAHACGHHIQMGNLLGVGLAFAETGMMKELSGDLTLMAVPGEEFIELDYRRELIKQKRLDYPGGKQQLIQEGVFDDVDLAMMIHAQAGAGGQQLYLDGQSLGFMSKHITFTGKEAHASTPFDGVNALNAAMIALMSIHANRDTFRDGDRIRIHPIITNGGDIVNTIPGWVTIETYVRAANAEAIVSAAQIVDNCINAGALALGAKARICNEPGYLPLRQDAGLNRILEENAKLFMQEKDICRSVDMVGSTDMGDLSHLIPCIHPTIGGFTGTVHGSDFSSCNHQFNVITAVKLLCCTIVDLLKEGAENAKQIKNQFRPVFTKEEYLEYLRHSF